MKVVVIGTLASFHTKLFRDSIGMPYNCGARAHCEATRLDPSLNRLRGGRPQSSVPRQEDGAKGAENGRSVN
jgi:hypothetical protein